MGNRIHLPSSVAAAVFEALIGALYLDAGLEPTQAFVLKHTLPHIEENVSSEYQRNYKSQLQQHAQKVLGATPNYEVLDEKGPDHSKCFKIAALIGRYHYAAAWGRNKKEAEQKAAMNAIAQINGDEIPFKVD